MAKKNTSGIALYKEDLKQSIEELTDLQRKMLSLTLSDLNPEDFNLDKIYPVSVDSFSEFRCQNVFADPFAEWRTEAHSGSSGQCTDIPEYGNPGTDRRRN